MLGGGPKCPVCSKTVYFAEEVQASGLKFHKRCFKCCECLKSLEPGSHCENESRLYCKACHNKKYGIKGYGYGQGAGTICMEGQVSASSSVPGISDPNKPAEIEVVKEGSDFCPRCKKRVYAAERVAAINYNWHKFCFKCKSCNKVLDSLTCTDREGEVYCKGCYAKEFGPKGYGFGQGSGTLTYTE